MVDCCCCWMVVSRLAVARMVAGMVGVLGGGVWGSLSGVGGWGDRLGC